MVKLFNRAKMTTATTGTGTITLGNVLDGYQSFSSAGVVDGDEIRYVIEEEILTIQNQTKSDWESTGFVSWIFNEETCSFDPPITYPDDGNAYNWNEESQEWDLVN
jgi:hypothetical protein